MSSVLITVFVSTPIQNKTKGTTQATYAKMEAPSLLSQRSGSTEPTEVPFTAGFLCQLGWSVDSTSCSHKWGSTLTLLGMWHFLAIAGQVNLSYGSNKNVSDQQPLFAILHKNQYGSK
jgi:hypothetical protein